MKIDIGGGVRLYVDVEGPGLVPDGPGMRERPTLICVVERAAFVPIRARRSRLHFACGEIRTMDLAPGLARAQCPVLVMAGEEDPVCPVADPEEIVAALPASLVRFARFPEVGHGAWRDDPPAAFAVLRQFVTAEINAPLG